LEFRKSTIREYFESLVATAIIALFATTFVVQAFKIPTGSMENNLLVGDHLLVNKFVYGLHSGFLSKIIPYKEPQREDVIVFKFPNEPEIAYVKRLIGMPGDKIEMIGRTVYVNGEALKEDYTQYIEPGSIYSHYGPYQVPPGQYFAMGDNRDNSYDSRFWGPLDRKLVLGKAMILHLSWAPDPDAPNFAWSNPLTYPPSLFYNITHFYKRVRWDRLGDIVR